MNIECCAKTFLKDLAPANKFLPNCPLFDYLVLKSVSPKCLLHSERNCSDFLSVSLFVNPNPHIPGRQLSGFTIRVIRPLVYVAYVFSDNGYQRRYATRFRSCQHFVESFRSPRQRLDDIPTLTDILSSAHLTQAYLSVFLRVSRQFIFQSFESRATRSPITLIATNGS